MKIVTFNIRVITDDGVNNFYNRIGFIRQKIKAEMPDVIAFQEVTDAIREALIEALP